MSKAQNNYFALFDLPEILAINAELLQKRYENLQKVYHPDRFSQGSATEQRLALAMSATINSAYQTLKNPLTRAEHLLSLQGIAPSSDSLENKVLLMEQWEWREKVEEAKNTSDIFMIKSQLEAQLKATFSDLANALSTKEQFDKEHILDSFHRLRFFTKLHQELQKNQAVKAQ